MAGTTISYARKGATGTIAVKNKVSVGEAVELHGLALRALHDTKAHRVQVDLSLAPSIDASGLQVLVALKRQLSEQQREFVVLSSSEALQRRLDLVAV